MPKISRRETAAPDNEPDAELLRLDAEYRSLLAEIHAGGHRDAKGNISDEAGEHLETLAGGIATTPANTFAGLAIKLRIGTDNQRFKWDLGIKETELTTDERALMTALADAERLSGGVV